MLPPTPPNVEPPEPPPGQLRRAFAWLIPGYDVASTVRIVRRQLDDLQFQYEHRTDGQLMSWAEYQKHRAIILDDLVGYPEAARIAVIMVGACAAIPVVCGAAAWWRESWRLAIVTFFFAWVWLFFFVRHVQAFLVKRGLPWSKRPQVVESLHSLHAITEVEADRLRHRLAKQARKMGKAVGGGDAGKRGPSPADRTV